MNSNHSKYRMIWQLMEGERRRYGAAIGALVLASCFMYLVPLIPQVVLDGVLPAEPEGASTFVRRMVEWGGGREFLRGHLWLAAVGIAVLTAAAGLFTYLRGRWSANASEQIVRRVRDRLYDHLQHLPVSYYDKAETGDLVQRCTSDVETLRQFLAQQVVEIGRAALMMLVPIPLMLALDVRMTLVSVAIIPPIVLFSFFYFRRVQASFTLVDEAEGRLTSTVQENLTGIRVVRAFARQEFEKEKFAERNVTHRDLDNRLYVLFAWFWGISDLMCMGQKALVVGLGGYWLLVGDLQVGTFYFFLAAVNLFIWPIRMMGRILAQLGKAMVAIGRIGEILDHPEETEPPLLAMPEPQVIAAPERQEDAVPAPQLAFMTVEKESTAGSDASRALAAAGDRNLSGEIVFDRVSFAFTGETRVLDDVSFRVAPGETLALLGPTGAGKSTIVNLLLRFHDPDSGAILLDGRDIGTMSRQAVRSAIALVMQEPFLYSKTVRENIRVGRAAADDDEIRQAARTACVHDAIEAFDDGYDTLVGERGVTLSGGQRQRVALARALLYEPAIMILDDALSAVDTGTEKMILAALRRRRGRHTTVVIAHRLSTLRQADQILVIDHGRAIQRGTHDRLVQEEGLYRRLWVIQSAVEDDLATDLRAVSRGA